MQEFSGTVERFPGKGGWYYVEVPKALVPVGLRKTRWGFIPAECVLGVTRWKAALLPKGQGRYFIALKASVRKREAVQEGDRITVGFWLS